LIDATAIAGGLHVIYLGVDVGKDDFHCAMLENDKWHRNSFPNTRKGFDKLTAWLRNRKVKELHVCMEATGGFSEALAQFLSDREFTVSIVNAFAIKAFGQSELSRTKTDKADAALIARYAAAMKPPAWEPPTPSERRLRQLVRRRDDLVAMSTQERNRLEAPGADEIADSIENSLAFLEDQIAEIDREIREVIDGDEDLRGKRDLLESIPGIGKQTSAALLGELPRLDEMRSAKAAVALAGLCPHQRQSGTSLSTSRLTSLGRRPLRRLFYMPAITARRYNPRIKAFAERLAARGKTWLQINVAVMRKLLVLAYSVLKSGRRFDPTWA
jgi:transposase